jgi:class 3 adenylate cyclase
MRCSACGTENRHGARFCNGCGSALAATCASSGQSNPPGSRFCDACGQALTAPPRTVEPTTGPTLASPQSYTPRHLAAKILAGRDALAGERKQVTVLFADVVGSTELIQGRDAEEAQSLLDGVVRVMMDAVHRYEGTVSRLMGDGLMAMFGAPVAHEDHTVRACYAALAMLEAVRTYAEDVRRAHGTAIRIRVGLNSGEVVMRLISDDLHMDYTAMGESVHLASRMEGLADAGSALLTRDTLALAEGYIEVRPLGPTAVKGLDRPVEAYELVHAGPARTRLQASSGRGLTPFVGRQEERAALDRALTQARAGQGQVAALVAEAGVGKSRLVWETIRADGARGWRVLQTGAVSYGQSAAWLPVVDLLRAYFGIENHDDHAAIRDKTVAGLRGLDQAMEDALPALFSLLDVAVEDAAWSQRDPTQRRRATLRAVQQLLLRESQRQPLLLVVEDLHWIDSETQALLDALVESLPTARILLLVNYRPEYSHTWGSKTYYTQLRIDPLGEQGAGELLDGLLGPDSSIQPLTALLIRRTEGNPFFVEESIRALVETGTLVGERGAYRLTQPVEEIRVPSTVQALLAARIDRLPPEEKRLLQTASVIGKDVPFVLLQRIADTPDARLRAGLSRLQAGELLYAVSLFPDLEFTFRHGLTHEVTYGGLLQERRRALHARIVDAIEALYPDRLDVHVERLAHHALRGERWEAALSYCREAGARDMARSAHHVAVHHLEQAIDAARRLPESPDALTALLDLHLELRIALVPLGALDQEAACVRQAFALAEMMGDQHRLALALAQLGDISLAVGDHDTSIAAIQRARHRASHGRPPRREHGHLHPRQCPPPAWGVPAGRRADP